MAQRRRGWSKSPLNSSANCLPNVRSGQSAKPAIVQRRRSCSMPPHRTPRRKHRPGYGWCAFDREQRIRSAFLLKRNSDWSRECPRCARECALEIVMTRLVAAAAAALILMSGCACAASFLSEQQARAKAINILKGDPYGKTPDEVSKNIKQTQFAQDGNTRACGARKIPAWEFHVVVVTADKDQFNNGVIDGFLALDARTGKILCANLPLLD